MFDVLLLLISLAVACAILLVAAIIIIIIVNKKRRVRLSSVDNNDASAKNISDAVSTDNKE